MDVDALAIPHPTWIYTTSIPCSLSYYPESFRYIHLRGERGSVQDVTWRKIILHTTQAQSSAARELLVASYSRV